MRSLSRPHTSIIFRHTKRQQATKQTDIDFYITNETTFGDEAPKYRIGGSRREPRPPPITPSPGEYCPPSEGLPKDTRLHHRITTSHAEVRAEMTTNIDYIDHRVFPLTLQRKIGERDSTTFYSVSYDAPVCSYHPGISFEKPRISIASRIRELEPPKVPGPGTYDHMLNPTLPRNPAFSFSGPKYRDDWLTDTKQTPSPDQYNPVKVVSKKMPYITIGDRSRTKAGIRRNHQKVFPVGPFFVKLDESVTINEARSYCGKHPELKGVVMEIFDLISEKHPEDPVMALALHFKKFEKEKKTETPYAQQLIIHYSSKK